jgi:hypothetical protein
VQGPEFKPQWWKDGRKEEKQKGGKEGRKEYFKTDRLQNRSFKLYRSQFCSENILSQKKMSENEMFLSKTM